MKSQENRMSQGRKPQETSRVAVGSPHQHVPENTDNKEGILFNL